MTIALPVFVASCRLVAVIVTAPAIAGAVKLPLALMLPSLADHVTPGLKLPVPCTVAAHCDVPLAALTVVGLQVIETEVTVVGGEGGAACTVRVAVPDLLASCVLVAVTVTLAADAGAVNNPADVIVPPVADQFTAEE